MRQSKLSAVAANIDIGFRHNNTSMPRLPLGDRFGTNGIRFFVSNDGVFFKQDIHHGHD